MGEFLQLEELFVFMGPFNGNVGLLTNESVPNLNMIADETGNLVLSVLPSAPRYMEKPDVADILAGIQLS